jgi:hypothetical protein
MATDLLACSGKAARWTGTADDQRTPLAFMELVMAAVAADDDAEQSTATHIMQMKATAVNDRKVTMLRIIGTYCAPDDVLAVQIRLARPRAQQRCMVLDKHSMCSSCGS